jgi:hypothetical protein
MAVLYTLLIGFLGGVFGALITDFVRTPHRQFFTLRTEIRQEMLRLDNVRVPDASWRVPTYTEDTLEKMLSPIREAQATLRSLGTRMIAFAETEWIAANIVRYRGYDPLSAGQGLIGLSNSVAVHGPGTRRTSRVHQQNITFSRLRGEGDEHSQRRSGPEE